MKGVCLENVTLGDKLVEKENEACEALGKMEHLRNEIAAFNAEVLQLNSKAECTATKTLNGEGAIQLQLEDVRRLIASFAEEAKFARDNSANMQERYRSAAEELETQAKRMTELTQNAYDISLAKK